MNSYTTETPPKAGNAKRIWNALSRADLNPTELHYNPNCWGGGRVNGWGTWACTIWRHGAPYECFCGITAGTVYIQSLSAPYGAQIIQEAQQ